MLGLFTKPSMIFRLVSPLKSKTPVGFVYLKYCAQLACRGRCWNLREASCDNLLISKRGINSHLACLWICFLLRFSVYSPSWLWTRILYRSLQPFCFKMGLVLISPEEIGSVVDRVFPLFSSGCLQCIRFSKCTTCG